MTELFTSLNDFCQFQMQLLNANATDLGVADVWFTDQNKIPRTPAVCVEPNTKRRDYRGSAISPLLDVSFENYILVYASRITDVQQNAVDAVVLAELIEDLIDADNQMQGQMIATLVTLVEYGIANKSGMLMRSARITVTGMTQKFKPANL